MRREQLFELMEAAGRVLARREIVIVGSQAVHAITDRAPAEVLVSLECDILLDEGDAAADALSRELGRESPFHAERGLYIDVVPPGIPVLPTGWRNRLQPLEAGQVVGQCLEVHDLAVAKLAAGRLKDYEFVASLLMRSLALPSTIRERVASLEGERWRAAILARLQIVIESLQGQSGQPE